MIFGTWTPLMGQGPHGPPLCDFNIFYAQVLAEIVVLQYPIKDFRLSYVFFTSAPKNPIFGVFLSIYSTEDLYRISNFIQHPITFLIFKLEHSFWCQKKAKIIRNMISSTINKTFDLLKQILYLYMM